MHRYVRLCVEGSRRSKWEEHEGPGQPLANRDDEGEMIAFRALGFALVMLALTSMPTQAEAQADGYIEGQIFDEATGQPMADWVTVEVYNESGVFVLDQAEPTDAAGRYQLGPIPPGNYRLKFHDARLAGYIAEWWQDQPDARTATVVEVTDGQVVTGIDFFVAMPVDPGGWITGVVTDTETGDPVSTISPVVFDLDGNRIDHQAGFTSQFTVRSGTDGVYRTGNLGSGSFKLWFEDSGRFVYESGWYGGTGFEDAAIINVALGVETAGIDISLTLTDNAQPPTQVEPPVQVLPFTGLAAESIAVIGFSSLLLGLAVVVSTTRLCSLAPGQAGATADAAKPKTGRGFEHRT